MVKFDILEKKLLTGRNLIEASAGTGKTYSIALLFLRFLLEKKLGIKEILTVTFTKSAVEELRSRIRTFIKDGYDFAKGKHIENEHIEMIINKQDDKKEASLLLKQALLSFDEASIFTIHGFCQRVLIENSFESGTSFGVELIGDDSFYKRERTTDFLRQYFYNMPVPQLTYIESKINIEILIKLAKGLESLNNIVIPDPKNKTIDDCLKEINITIDEVSEIFNQSKNIWENSGRDEIHDLIKNSNLDGRKRTHYKENRYLKVDQYFKPKDNGLNIDKNTKKLLEYFSFEKVFQKAKLTHPFFEKIDQLLKLKKEIDTSIDKIKVVFLKTSLDDISLRKAKASVQSFSDLINNIKTALNGAVANSLKTALQEQYKAVLIDEFQDTDPVQFEIFKKIFDDNKTILFFIGDPKQSIYNFRGADIFAYIDVIKSGYIKEKKRYSMDKNFRSSSNFVEAVNKLFTQKKDPFLNNAINMEKVLSKGTKEEFKENGTLKEPLKILFKHSKDVESYYLSRKTDKIKKKSAEIIFSRYMSWEIARLLNIKNNITIGNNVVKPSDIAILVRSNKQGRIVKKQLGESNIPSVFTGDNTVFKSNEATELFAILNAISEPGNIKLLRGAWITSLMGGKISDLQTIDEPTWEKELLKIRDLHNFWIKNGFYPMFRKFISENKIKENLLSQKNGERQITNLFHLSEIINQESLKKNLGMVGILDYFAERIKEEEQIREYEQRLESDLEAVQIVTIHKSKGLEYPIVFCPFLWNSISLRENDIISFHKEENIKEENTKEENTKEENTKEENTKIKSYIGINKDAISDDEQLLAKEEICSEELRLMYVAITRAVHRCYILWGKIDKMASSAPTYLFHDHTKYDKMSPDALYQDLQKLDMEDCIKVSLMPDETLTKLEIDSDKNSSLTVKEFKGKIPHIWGFTSYSAIIKNASNEFYELPGIDDSNDKKESEIQELNTIFSFPKGAKTGLAWHEILEKIDFTKETHLELIKTILQSYNLSEQWMIIQTDKMVKKILTTPLAIDNRSFTLSKISNQNKFPEMEFYFKIKKVTQDMLINTIGEYAKGLKFNTLKGFMKGFIDLIFEYKGKYFIIDWKSNYLGDSLYDYRFPYETLKEAEISEENNNILNAMKEHHYILQYYIYSVAVHLYLSQRLKDYDYDTHFGGVFYLFTRGVDGLDMEDKISTGIFRDRPDKKLIEDLTECLIGDGR